MRRYFFFLFLPLLPWSVSAQQFQVTAIGYYNFENLFDTLDTEGVRDTEFSPRGTRKWTADRYQDKLQNLAKVVGELGTELTPDGPAILGVSEIENRSVLEDFVRQEAIADRDYQIIHYDSPDRRGIDVALLYQGKYFQVIGSEVRSPELVDRDGDKVLTRDILHVHGMLGEQELHVLVNHWPSRRGGEKASRPLRNGAARMVRHIADSIWRHSPDAGIIVMGDLNDDPTNESVRKVLRAKAKVSQVGEADFYNPWAAYFKKGFGTLAYRDAWSLFDQILLSPQLLDRQSPDFFFYRADIHNPPYLVQTMGHYRGYPYRTFDFDEYISGYSDHFPVVVYLVRPWQKEAAGQ